MTFKAHTSEPTKLAYKGNMNITGRDKILGLIQPLRLLRGGHGRRSPHNFSGATGVFTTKLHFKSGVTLYREQTFCGLNYFFSKHI